MYNYANFCKEKCNFCFRCSGFCSCYLRFFFSLFTFQNIAISPTTCFLLILTIVIFSKKGAIIFGVFITFYPCFSVVLHWPRLFSHSKYFRENIWTSNTKAGFKFQRYQVSFILYVYIMF